MNANLNIQMLQWEIHMLKRNRQKFYSVTRCIWQAVSIGLCAGLCLMLVNYYL